MIDMLRVSPRGMAIHAANYIPDNHTEWRRRKHSNPHWQLMLVKGDQLRFKRDKHKLVMHHGHTLILEPNEIHSSWGDDPSDAGFYYVQFSGDWIERSTAAHDAAPTTNQLPFDLPLTGRCRGEKAFALFDELVHELQSRPPHYRAGAIAVFHHLLVTVARDATALDGRANPLHPQSPQQANVVAELKRFLEANFRLQLTSETISQHLAYNYAYLSRVFRQVMGITITDYIHYLRIEEARTILLEMNDYDTIRDVAQLLGYDDPSYFARVFRRFEGMSPTDYIRGAYGRVRE